VGIFTDIMGSRNAAAQVEAQRGILADHLTIRWLVTAICERTELTHDQAAQLVVGVASGGGPDIRTGKGMACVSVILGVPGAPIQPALH
jgi:hypothetical protein